MTTLSLPVGKIIRENVSILMSYAFSTSPLQDWANKSLEGEFKSLRESLFCMSAQRAEKACLELAIFLRYLDDEEGLSKYYKQNTDITFGTLHMKDESTSDLSIRDVTNKIIHAVSFEWDFSRPMKPVLVCKSRDTEKWSEARVDITNVSVACGMLMSD